MSVSPWQIAAGLGVGAFFGVIFYVISKQFGRHKGQGFETSKLGSQATAIIATLIIMIAGSATIVALVLYKPAPQSQENFLPPEARSAIDGWERGSSLIIAELRNHLEGYETSLAGLMGCRVEDLPEATKRNPDAAKRAHRRLVNDCDQAALTKYLSQEIDPRVVNPRLRQYFPAVRVRMDDGRELSLDEATRAGREMKDAIFLAAFDAATSGRNPVDDDEVHRRLETYSQRRQAITEALEEHVAARFNN